MNQTIAIGVIAALAAGLGCTVAHGIAKRLHWPYIPRYVTGVALGNAAFAFVVFSALTVEQAAILYGLLWLIYGIEGLATWLSHENDPDPRLPLVSLTPEADRMLQNMDEELRK
jgi:hypothetical protein